MAQMAQIEVVVVIVVLVAVRGTQCPRCARLGEVLRRSLEGVAAVATNEVVVEEVVHREDPAPSVHYARVARAPV